MSKLVKKVFKAVKKVASGVGKFVKKHWKKIAIAALVVFTAGAAAVVAAGGTWGGAIASVGSTFSAGASALTGGVIGTSAASAAGAAATTQAGLAAAQAAVTAGTATSAQAAAVAASQAGLTGSALTGAATNAAATTAAGAGGISGAISGAANSVGNFVGGGLKTVGIQGNAAANGVNAASNAAMQTATKEAAREAAKQALIKSGQTVTEQAITQTMAQGGMSAGKAMLIGTGIQVAGALYQGREQQKAEEEAQKKADNASWFGMNAHGKYANGFSEDGMDSGYMPTYGGGYQAPVANAYQPTKPLLNRPNTMAYR